MNKDDYDYNTSKLKTIYSIDLNNLRKENKLRYLDTINLNLSFLKDSKISNKDELLSLNKKALEEVNKL